MITESTIYWITRLDYLQGFGFIVGGTIALFAFGLAIISGVCWANQDCKGKHFAAALISLLLSLILLVGTCFIPSTKEMCAIKIIPIVANNKEAQEIPQKVIDLANEWIEELKPDKKEKSNDPTTS